MAVTIQEAEFSIQWTRSGPENPGLPIGRWFFRRDGVGDASGGNLITSFMPSQAEARRYVWGWDVLGLNSDAAVVMAVEWFTGRRGTSGVFVLRRGINLDTIAAAGITVPREGALLGNMPAFVVPILYGSTNFEWRTTRLNLGAATITELYLSGLLWSPLALRSSTGPIVP